MLRSVDRAHVKTGASVCEDPCHASPAESSRLPTGLVRVTFRVDSRDQMTILEGVMEGSTITRVKLQRP